MSPNPIINPENTSRVPTIENYEDFDKFLAHSVCSKDTLALLLDFDGTLATITPDPNNTYMTEKTKNLFKKICEIPNIYPAVISGREINDVKNRVGIDNIIYAGCHGLEILYKNGYQYDHHIPPEINNNFPIMCKELKQLETCEYIWVENKRTSITVHYHEIHEDDHSVLYEKASKIITKHGYLANKAHGAVDAKPPVQWNKGKAAIQILETEFGKNWRKNIKVIFAGDDISDEDAMKLLKGDNVTTFRISKNPEILTNADYRLESPDQVHNMLQWIENIFK